MLLLSMPALAGIGMLSAPCLSAQRVHFMLKVVVRERCVCVGAAIFQSLLAMFHAEKEADPEKHAMPTEACPCHGSHAVQQFPQSSERELAGRPCQAWEGWSTQRV